MYILVLLMSQLYLDFSNRRLLAVVVSQAFTNSQSAKAHFILFCHIFEVASQDTGTAIWQLQHIHGKGSKTIVTDAHRGHALGMLCIE